MRCLAILLLFALPAWADKDALLKETIKQLDTAYKSGDWHLVRGALWRAKSIRDRYSSKEALPLARAVSEGLSNENTDIAVAAIRTLADMAVPGSTKYLLPMLKPPADVPIARRKVYFAGIQAVGDLHETMAIPALERLIMHPDRDLAVAGAATLTRYKYADDKVLLDLVQRLAGTLEKFKKDLREAKKKRNKAKQKHLETLKDAVLETLRSLTDKETFKEPRQFQNWVKQQRKKLKVS
jgi:hypothetical protein